MTNISCLVCLLPSVLPAKESDTGSLLRTLLRFDRGEVFSCVFGMGQTQIPFLGVNVCAPYYEGKMLFDQLIRLAVFSEFC